MKKFSELKESWAPAQGHVFHSKTNDELRRLEKLHTERAQELRRFDPKSHAAHQCQTHADIARAILNHRATSRNRDMKESLELAPKEPHIYDIYHQGEYLATKTYKTHKTPEQVRATIHPTYQKTALIKKRTVTESAWEIYKQKALNESATPLKTGQMVKIASGYGSGTEGRLGSINSRTGEAIIFPTPLIPMMTHIKYLKALHESALNVKTLSAEEIAQKHGVSVEQIKDQIAKGIKVEHEHVTSDQTAEEIARDHLGERPDYYTVLDKAKLEEADLKAQWNTDFSKDSYARRSNLRRTIKQQLNPKTPGLGNKAWTRADKEDKKNRPSTYSIHELHDEPDRPGTGIGVSGDGTEKGMAMTEDGPSTKKTITKAEWDHHTRHATAQFDTEGQRWIVQQDATGSATRIPVNVTEDYPYRQTIRRVLREAFPMAPKSTEKPDNTQDDEEKGEAPKAKKEKAIDPVVIGKSKDKFEADPVLTPVLSVANMPGGSVR